MKAELLARMSMAFVVAAERLAAEITAKHVLLPDQTNPWGV